MVSKTNVSGKERARQNTELCNFTRSVSKEKKTLMTVKEIDYLAQGEKKVEGF